MEKSATMHATNNAKSLFSRLLITSEILEFSNLKIFQ